MVSGLVCCPPTTSTSGSRWGGLNGCPTRKRWGWARFCCMTEGMRPDEDEAMMVAAPPASSLAAARLARRQRLGRIERRPDEDALGMGQILLHHRGHEP